MAARVRQLAPDEWPLLRELRVAALTDAPDQFAESSAVASRRSDQEWATLTGSDAPGAACGTYIAELNGNSVGMVFAIEDRTDPTTGRLGGMWVKPSARGAGVGMALVTAVIGWCQERSMLRVRLWVVPQTAAERLYHRAMFIPTGVRKPFPGDDARSIAELQRVLRELGEN